MTDERSSSLQRDLIVRLERDYDALPTSALYQVFAKAVEGRGEAALLGVALPVDPPPPGVQEQQERHIAEVLDALLCGPYADLEDRAVNNVFAAVALAFDKLVRQRGEYVEAPPKLDPGEFAAEQTPAGAGMMRRPLSSAGRARTAPGPARSARSVSSKSTVRPSGRMEAVTAPPPAPLRARVSGRTVAFELVWSCDSQTAELLVDDDVSLERLALELRDEPGLELPLEPEPILGTAVLLKLGVREDSQRFQVRGGVRGTGAVTKLEVLSLPPELSPFARRASKRMRGMLTAAESSSSAADTPLPSPDATPFDSVFGGGEDSGFKIRRSSGASQPGPKATTRRRTEPGAADTSRSGEPSPDESTRPDERRPDRVAQSTPPPVPAVASEPEPEKLGDSHRDPAESSLPVTEEDRAASRRRRARVRRSSSSRRSSGLQEAVGRFAQTPSSGTPVVPREPGRQPSAARRRAAERRALGVHEPVSDKPPTATQKDDLSAPPREERSGFFRRDSSATRQVVERSGTSSSRREHRTDAETEFGRDDSSFGRRESSSSHRTVDEASWFRDSWTRKSTPSSLRRRQLFPEPTFGEELGSDEGENVAGGASTLMLACGSRWPSVALFIVAGGARWRALLREDLLLDLQVEPEDPRFDVVTLLRDSGLVQDEDIEEALHAAQEDGLGLLEELSRMRKLRYREVDALQTSRWRLMLEHLFTTPIDRWEAAGFEHVELRGPAPLSYAPIAWQTLIDRVDEESLEAAEGLLHEHMGHKPQFRSDARLTCRALGMDARSRKLVDDVIDGTASTREVLSKSPLRKRPTMSIVIALDEIGLIEWHSIDARGARVEHALPRLREKLAEIENNEIYAALDMHWSSDDQLVLESWRRVVRVLDLDMVKRHGDESARALAKAVDEGLIRLRDGLRSVERRRMLRSKEVDSFEIGAAVQLYIKQAEIALFKRDAESAEDALRRVVELDPDDAESKRRLGKVLAYREKLGTPTS